MTAVVIPFPERGRRYDAAVQQRKLALIDKRIEAIWASIRKNGSSGKKRPTTRDRLDAIEGRLAAVEKSCGASS